MLVSIPRAITVVGPIAGGFLAEAAGWRWVFWLITIAVGLCAILIAANYRLANQVLGGNIDSHNVCVKMLGGWFGC
jgi:MFS family permease